MAPPGMDSMAGGPPPPEMRQPDQATPPPMPSSIISGQGEQAAQATGQEDSLKKQAVGLAVQKLLEFKNTIEGLLVAFKAVDPEAVALFIPGIELGKALEARLQAVLQRAGKSQPSMAGLPGGGQPPQVPGGVSAGGM